MAGKKKIVLVVEDDKYIGGLICKKLKKNGIETKACFDGREALDILSKELFDLVLLDLVMPVLDGFAVLEQKHATLNSKTPFTILTALGQDSDLDRARKLGAADVIQKAYITIEEVVNKVMKKLD